jgi:hypothetical protein
MGKRNPSKTSLPSSARDSPDHQAETPLNQKPSPGMNLMKAFEITNGSSVDALPGLFNGLSDLIRASIQKGRALQKGLKVPIPQDRHLR